MLPRSGGRKLSNDGHRRHCKELQIANGLVLKLLDEKRGVISKCRFSIYDPHFPMSLPFSEVCLGKPIKNRALWMVLGVWENAVNIKSSAISQIKNVVTAFLEKISFDNFGHNGTFQIQ